MVGRHNTNRVPSLLVPRENRRLIIATPTDQSAQMKLYSPGDGFPQDEAHLILDQDDCSALAVQYTVKAVVYDATQFRDVEQYLVCRRVSACESAEMDLRSVRLCILFIFKMGI